jgi:hypothetical protein
MPEQEKGARHPVFDSPELMKNCNNCLMSDRCSFYEMDGECTFQKKNLSRIKDQWQHGDSAAMLFETIAELKNILEVGRMRYKNFPSISMIKGYETLGYLIDKYFKVTVDMGKFKDEELAKEMKDLKDQAQIALMNQKIKKKKKEEVITNAK